MRRRRPRATLLPNTTLFRSEWIAVPVPDAGIPRELVDAAREAVKDNRRPSRAGNRFWQLSGGLLRCGACDRSMASTRRSEEHTSELQSRQYLVCRLLLELKN